MIRSGLVKIPIGMAAIVLLLYLAALAALAVEQRKFLFLPGGEVVEPQQAGLHKAQALYLTTEDGETLFAWYKPPAPDKPLLLYFHGNGGNLAIQAGMLQAITAAGNGVLAVEYRGYPGSTGSSSEQGLLLDAEAAYAKAQALGIPDAKIVVFGQSLGSGVAVALAARHKVGALVLDSPFTSAQAVASRLYWMFPVGWVMKDPFHSDERITKVTAPLLIVHGTADPVIPFDLGETLFGLANQPKTFIKVNGMGHLAIGAALPQVLDWIGRTVRS
jgi:fermentation-respiration switch protein FrsA (DUF1100 family)